MKRACALLAALLLCLALAGCMDTMEQEEQPQEPFWNLPAQPEEEEKTGFTAFSLPYYEGQSLDPIDCADGVSLTISSLLYEGLFALDGQFEPYHVLCADFSVDRTKKVYTFYIRPDALFSDGSAVTANDVLATYRRAQESARYGARFANVTGMRVSRGALVITLAKPDSAFPALLDIPVTRSNAGRYAVPPGTGMYTFSDGEDGVCLLRNEYHTIGAPGPLERIPLVSAKDADSAAYLFSAGSVNLLRADLTSDTPASSLSSVDFADAPTTTLLYLGFQLGREIPGDMMLRRMLGQAVNRSELCATLLSGHALAARFPISPLALKVFALQSRLQ